MGRVRRSNGVLKRYDGSKRKVNWRKLVKEYAQRKNLALTIEEKEYGMAVVRRCVGQDGHCPGLNACLDECHPPMGFKTCMELVEHRILCNRLHTFNDGDMIDGHTVFNCLGQRKIWFCHDKAVNDSAMVEAKLTTKDVEWLSKPVAEVVLSAKEVRWISRVKKWCAEECGIEEGQCLGGLCLDPCHPMMKFDTCHQIVNHLVKCHRIHALGGLEDCGGHLDNVSFHRFSTPEDLLQ